MVQFKKFLHFSAFLFLKEYENAKADMNFWCLKLWTPLITSLVSVPSSCVRSTPKMYPKQTAAVLGVADLRILDFETTWSEFHKPSQSTAMQGEAKLHILDLKTTLSDFHNPYQTAVRRGKAEPHTMRSRTNRLFAGLWSKLGVLERGKTNY